MRLFLTTLAAIAFLGCSGGNAETASAALDENTFTADLPNLSGDDVWDLDQGKSQVTFQANHNGAFDGEFSRFDATIKLDPADPSDGQIHAIVDVTSIDAGDSDRNANLPLPDWFDMKTFPHATFISEQISKTDTGYDAIGELSIKGIGRPATLSFTLDVQGNTAHAIGGFAMDRRDFSLGTSSDFQTEEWVKFPIDVKIDIWATR